MRRAGPNTCSLTTAEEGKRNRVSKSMYESDAETGRAISQNFGAGARRAGVGGVRKWGRHLEMLSPLRVHLRILHFALLRMASYGAGMSQHEFMLKEKNREIEERNQKIFSRLSKIQYVTS